MCVAIRPSQTGPDAWFTSASPFVAISLKQVQLQCVDVDSAAGRLLSRGVLPDHLADVRQTQRRFRRRRALPG